MPMRSPVVPVICLGAAVLVSGCDIRVGEGGISVGVLEGRANEESTKTYSLAPGGTLEIVNGEGNIEVFPAPGAQVEMRIRREIRSRTDESAQELLKQFTIQEDVSEGRVRVETQAPRAERGFRERARADYRVALPEGLNVALTTQNGGVRLDNVGGRIAVTVTNGGITGQRIAGTLEATLVNGGIVVNMASVNDDMRLSTVNGGIVLNIPPDIDATLDASTVNGGVAVDGDVPMKDAERSRQRVAGAVNGGGGPVITLHATNGGVRVGTNANAQEAPPSLSETR